MCFFTSWKSKEFPTRSLFMSLVGTNLQLHYIESPVGIGLAVFIFSFVVKKEVRLDFRIECHIILAEYSSYTENSSLPN